MTTGIAIKLGAPMKGDFHPLSQVYRLWPSLGMSETADNHVVVAFTPAAADHKKPETTIFKSDANGSTTVYGGLDGGAEALETHQRVVGRHDPSTALASLAGGYLIVEQEELAALEQSGKRSALHFAQKVLRLSQQDSHDYSENNWGTFAARHAQDAKRVRNAAPSSETSLCKH